jgi:hypothetical protein
MIAAINVNGTALYYEVGNGPTMLIHGMAIIPACGLIK